MKVTKYLPFGLCCAFVALMASCSGRQASTGISLAGYTDLDMEGKMVYLCDPYTKQVEDSALVFESKFRFDDLSRYADSLCVKELCVDFLYLGEYSVHQKLPVVMQPGKLQVRMGETLAVTGSLLNDQLNHLLVSLSDATIPEEGQTIDVAKAKTAISSIIGKSVAANADNALGKYIKFAYGDKITE